MAGQTLDNPAVSHTGREQITQARDCYLQAAEACALANTPGPAADTLPEPEPRTD
ncbi:hypothetical protein STRCI_005589 [Streptomyces cinnabarinus]|uniref:Uncharacterized protein n=1 Tax=Streptomyces cinnabarinus TaxID=67287 RepID=A0ABY7KNA1_9ACTN|nr:hypothetical protein [Streptomyces cinnabarinus]WAZ24191.1 hypothetical protein STRCI_005589 [Streptomyces cinnabarinus]